MYSKIPMPKTDWTKEAMKYALCFFPAVGIVIGIVTIGWMYLAAQLGFGDLFRTAVLLLIPVAISGGIHLDGLLDTADALSSWKTMEEKLEILKDSHAGAFAIIVGISYFVLYFGILSEVQLADVKVLAVGFVLSRALSAFAMVTFRLAKKYRSGSHFFRHGSKRARPCCDACDHSPLLSGHAFYRSLPWMRSDPWGLSCLSLLSPYGLQEVWRHHRRSGGIFPTAL
jgi:cobalamin synthase